MKKSILSGAVMLSFVLAACGGTATQERAFNIHVTGTKSDVGDFSATKGDTIKITMQCDKEEEVHLHGYDIHFECKKDTPVTKTFTADKTGKFEYELEKTTDHLGDFTVNP